MPTPQFYEEAQRLRLHHTNLAITDRPSSELIGYDDPREDTARLRHDDQVVSYRPRQTERAYANPYDYPNRYVGNIDGRPNFPHQPTDSWGAELYRTARTTETDHEWCFRMDSLYRQMQRDRDGEREREEVLKAEFDEEMIYRGELLSRGRRLRESSERRRDSLTRRLRGSRELQEELGRDLERRGDVVKRYRNDPLREDGSH
ncbi:hypothetical protein LTR36_009960 [Oleoguttula mirabilis]|uniref:Uncharacterized protein n=1 Tax=Oleoguttula mirabilis TaxID=1507867 RepID=A0AAV9J584_9PEZI|nr:hypothetical protein LTR36_009960 [Oleoguttula mirabilis]